MASYSLRFWPITDVGKTRDHNEDSFLVDKKLNLFVVCDGMGGHAAGEIASRMAAESVRETLRQHRDALDDFRSGKGNTSRRDILRLLESAVQQACSAIHEEGVRDEQRRGMGTTLEALLIVGNRGFIAHVGDSRVYLFRQNAVHQITEDHSLINELIKRGRLTKTQIASVQYKNAVTRAVGVYPSVEVDVVDFDVLPDDRFLLCTDGLHGYFEEGELGPLWEKTPEEEFSKKLIDFANERGGSDNITAIIVHVPPQGAGDRLTAEVNLKIEILQKMPLFRYLTYKELVRLLNVTESKDFGAGETIVREGEEGDELFIVLGGRVRVHSGETQIARFGPGQFFGEMTLIDKSPRSADVTAEEKSRILVIRRKSFFDVIRTDHDLAIKLLWSFLGVLSQRLRSTSKELGEARLALAHDQLSKELLMVEYEDSRDSSV